MEYVHKNQGTCSLQTIVDLDGDTIRSVRFVGGCDGNTKGICALVKGMKVGEVVARCKGVTCGRKALPARTSWPRRWRRLKRGKSNFQAERIPRE